MARIGLSSAGRLPSHGIQLPLLARKISALSALSRMVWFGMAGLPAVGRIAGGRDFRSRPGYPGPSWSPSSSEHASGAGLLVVASAGVAETSVCRLGTPSIWRGKAPPLQLAGKGGSE